MFLFASDSFSPRRFSAPAVLHCLLFFVVLLLTTTLHTRPADATARDDGAHYDISYFWSTDLDRVRLVAIEIGRLLGPEVSSELRIVTDNSKYGLVYDRNGDEASTRQLAATHSKILQQGGFEGAYAVRESKYDYIYNIRYSSGTKLRKMKRDFEKVFTYLGEGVAKELYVTRDAGGNYELIYRRRGDYESTKKIAKKHSGLLSETGLTAGLSREKNSMVAYSLGGFSSGRGGFVVDSPDNIRKSRPRKFSAPDEPDVSFEKLELAVENYIKGLRRKGLISSDERTAWSVYDFTTGKKVVDINEDLPLQAASMIKPFVCLAFFHEARRGRIVYGPRSRAKMEAMIQRSNNSATNWIMKQVGGPRAVQRILDRNYGYIFKQTRIVEYIPSGGRTYRNKASAHDYSRYLFALYHNRLPYSKEMKRIMNLPGRDRIYTGAHAVPKGTKVYNKTGSTSRLCGDMGILMVPGRNGRLYAYTVIGIIEKPRGARSYSRWIKARGDAIREVSNIIYYAMKSRHGLI